MQDAWTILQKIGTIGKNPDGSYTRRCYSPEFFAAAEIVRHEMETLKMTVSQDASGSIHGILPGLEPGLKSIVMGSHLDTVPSGGLFDGALGVSAALDALYRLQESGTRLRHSVEVYGFNGEEFNALGGLYGSRVLTGLFDPDRPGMKEVLASHGHTPEEIKSCRRDFSDVKCYLEAHIEQGPELDAHHIPLGVVSGIAGVYRYRVTCLGQSNHGGTTMMPSRHDAMVGMAKLIVFGDEACRRIDDHLVFTAGTIACWPNSANVVPGKVECTFEMRHLDKAKTDALIREIEDYASRIGRVRFEFTALEEKPGVYSSPKIMKVFEQAAEKAGIPHVVMASGASHDAHAMARRVPMGMIFVPSKDGISHNGAEWTDPKDVKNAGIVLYEALKILDCED
jgi:hydantoinase/carbamoylase family amidase